MGVILATAETHTILIEVSDDPAVLEPDEGADGGGIAGGGEKAIKRLEEVGDAIGDVCDTLLKQLRHRLSAAKPDEFTLEFGVKLAGKAGIPLVSEGSAEATFKVTAKWKLTPGE